MITLPELKHALLLSSIVTKDLVSECVMVHFIDFPYSLFHTYHLHIHHLSTKTGYDKIKKCK